MTSQYLSPLQLSGLRHVGDVLIPGDGEMPSFSESRCITQSDRMFAYMNPDDLSGVRFIFTAFRFVPGPLLRAIFALTDRHRSFPEPIGAALRMINLGVKGVVMTLYYSDVGEGRSVYELIGWDAKVVEHGE